MPRVAKRQIDQLLLQGRQVLALQDLNGDLDAVSSTSSEESVQEYTPVERIRVVIDVAPWSFFANFFQTVDRSETGQKLVC